MVVPMVQAMTDPQEAAGRQAELARLMYLGECVHLGIMAWPEEPKEPSIYHRLADSVMEWHAAAVAAAVAEENQACADLVGQWAMLESRHVVSHVLDKLATAIRARYRTRPAPGRRAG